jgi:hypothetical protein
VKAHKPLTYRVKPPLGRKRYGWRLVTPAGAVQEHATQRLAVSWGRRMARNLWEQDGRPTQLVVHGRSGRIVDEASYGSDRADREG